MSGAAGSGEVEFWVVRKASLGRQRLVRDSEKLAADRERRDSGQTGIVRQKARLQGAGKRLE
ncbi:MAG: hypothetical protein DMG07_00165 [Acidobacteria bacterium]|nr:MAG: hypothetical protein DMG07_00165 [Acidobacteriota bacterium]